MNNEACRKAFEEFRSHVITTAEYNEAIELVGEDARDELKWVATAFLAAWNLKPKISMEELRDTLWKQDSVILRVAETVDLAQAIYEKLEAKE